MLNFVAAGIARLMHGPESNEVPVASLARDCGWHGSSFDLSHGLEVIEGDAIASPLAETTPAAGAPLQA